MTSYNDAAALAALAAKTFQASQGEDWKLKTWSFPAVVMAQWGFCHGVAPEKSSLNHPVVDDWMTCFRKSIFQAMVTNGDPPWLKSLPHSNWVPPTSMLPESAVGSSGYIWIQSSNLGPNLLWEAAKINGDDLDLAPKFFWSQKNPDSEGL